MKIVYSQTDNVYDDLAADEMRVYDNEGNHIDSEYVGPLCCIYCGRSFCWYSGGRQETQKSEAKRWCESISR